MTTAPVIEYFRLDGTPGDPADFEGKPAKPERFFYYVEATREIRAEFYVQAESPEQANGIADELVAELDWSYYDDGNSNHYVSDQPTAELPRAVDFWKWDDTPEDGEWDQTPWRLPTAQ